MNGEHVCSFDCPFDLACPQRVASAPVAGDETIEKLVTLAAALKPAFGAGGRA